MNATDTGLLGIPGPFLFALLLLASVSLFVYTVSRRYQLLVLGSGAPDERWNRIGERLRGVLELGVLQRKMFRDPYAGLYHFLIFSGFVILSIRTGSLVLEGLLPGAPLFFGQPWWHAYLLAKDVVLVSTLVGVILALGRRYVVRKARLDPSFDAALILCLIGLLMVSDLLAGAARFRLEPGYASRWEPATAWMAGLLDGASPATLRGMYLGGWWVHLVTILAFLNYLPLAKHFHIITALPNIFLRKLEPAGRLSMVDIEKAAESEKFGVSKVEDFTWKQKLDMFTCTECGRCREVCPTHLTGKTLTPKGFMVDLRGALYSDAPALVDAFTGRGDGKEPERRPLIGGWVDEETIWACTTCRYCEHACPVSITYVDKIVDLRRHLVLERSEFPKEAQTAFNGMERQGNPWNLSASDRDAWAKELPFPVMTMAEAAEGDVEVLFWVGCAGSYEERGKKVSRALATLLHEAGVKFAILGAEEVCNGETARRLGNEYLFQTLCQQNVETLNGYKVKKIVTNCPHCFNTLKNEYPQFGGSFEVVHGTELVARLVAEGRLTLGGDGAARTISFHDACYLGRYNGVIDAPREILAAIPGLTLKELPRTKNDGLCCGAGGGRMWLDEKIGARINQTRYREIEDAGTDQVGVACPFCMVMLGNAQTEMGGKTEPVDVLELAARALPAHPGQA